MKLTATIINTLPQGDYTDAILPGLTYRVGARRRSWQLRYRAGGKQLKVPLGFYVPNAPHGSESMGLAEARDKAREILSRVEAGVPVAEEPKPVHPKDTRTVGDMIDGYEKMKRRQGGKIKRLDEALRTVRAGLDAYLNLPASQFKKADLKKARDKIAKRAIHQSAAFQRYLGPVLKWASAEDWIEHNFSSDVLKLTVGVKRDRVLDSAEIAAVWKASLAMESAADATQATKSFARLIRFLLLTAQRKDEAASLRFGDILDGRWRQQQNKSSRPHIIPLSKAALDIVGQGKAGDFVFPGRLGGKIGGFSKLLERLQTLSGTGDWRLHDLRRSAATGFQELDVRFEIIESILNHALGGIAGIYQRSDLEKQKAGALEIWAEKLAEMASQSNSRTPKTENGAQVIALHGN